MVKRKMENLLAKELKKKFDQIVPRKFDRIYVSKRPFQAKKLKEQWHDYFARRLRVPDSLIPPLGARVKNETFKLFYSKILSTVEHKSLIDEPITNVLEARHRLAQSEGQKENEK